MRRRVVVTGIGMVTPLGHDPDATWRALQESKSGVDYISLFDASEFPTRIAGEVKNFSIADFGEREADWQYTGRNIRFAVGAAKTAMADAGLRSGTNVIPERFGVYLGAGEGGQDFFNFVDLVGKSTAEDQDHPDDAIFIREGMERFHPLREMEQEPGMSASHLADLFDCRGPNLNCLTACAASSQAIGEATEIIRRGDADVMISGGAHSMIHPMGVTGFIKLTALSTRNDPPQKASRPFDRDRDGFIIGEGAGVVILEELEHAKKRGARIYGEVAGYGTTADAFRVTDSHPEGRGAIACLEMALGDAGVDSSNVHYINAHGTSTDVNDRVETIAVKHVFGERAYKIPMSSIKSMTGHLIAAAGVVEAVVCLLAIRDRFAPPTINYENPDPECDLDYVPNVGRRLDRLDVAVSNSFGFGGQNVSLVLRRYVD
jgi:3-oxoacyl-[acyl-carrier-protein] synthase II